ncbi:4,5-DOPA dioxygenase extradiol [Altererythrobacter sp.]|uniref:4,5-DOPA-extradiol-dioxygenase n=1 Tax=Altererythrobacter sp. TaxID=1872480 RepID=UPI003D0EF6FA
MTTLPALFVGHGSPMTMITENAERTGMERLGQRLSRPKAILAITAHWETRGETRLTSGANPHTIHDFRGFPQELYDITYPAPGSPELARRAAELLGERAVLDDAHGFDHGVWGVLLPMFPDADIPAVAMSVDMALDTEGHRQLGEALAPLRDEGVLIVGSGNVIHNLALYRQTMGTQPDWALDFRARTNQALIDRRDDALTRFASDDRAASAAINSGEHYVPLLYSLGARRADDDVTLFNDTLDGALSMTSVLYGDAALAAGL